MASGGGDRITPMTRTDMKGIELCAVNDKGLLKLNGICKLVKPRNQAFGEIDVTEAVNTRETDNLSN
jgi:hypothetical protein